MVYPEAGGAAAEPAGDYYPSSGFGGITSRLGVHLEGLIPLILILIIALFLLIKFGVITTSTPGIGIIAGLFGGERPVEMLIIGTSSFETIEVLNDNPDLVHYRVVDARQLERNPAEQLANYQIIMLDQSEQADKTVSRRLGEAIENYVKRGGKLIVVKGSGIYREGAYDIIGWEASFGDVVPVRCDRIIANIPSCQVPLDLQGQLFRLDEDHRIMQGIEQFPADPMQHALMSTLDVTVSGHEIAYVREAGTGKQYPAIVEKNLIIGKSIYFNYNPGKTKGILENTLKYLR